MTKNFTLLSAVIMMSLPLFSAGTTQAQPSTCQEFYQRCMGICQYRSTMTKGCNCLERRRECSRTLVWINVDGVATKVAR